LKYELARTTLRIAMSRPLHQLPRDLVEKSTRASWVALLVVALTFGLGVGFRGSFRPTRDAQALRQKSVDHGAGEKPAVLPESATPRRCAVHVSSWLIGAAQLVLSAPACANACLSISFDQSLGSTTRRSHGARSPPRA
jgi:hypothetical protein